MWFLKEDYFRSIMKIQLKMKEIELNVLDYDMQPYKKAQILQLKFASELYMESNTFSKNVICTTVSIEELKLAQQEKDIDKLVIEDTQKEIIYRILEYNDTMQFNLNKLSIEHLLVDNWY